MQQLAQLCEELGAGVREIDINPLVVLPKGEGVRVLDCLIVSANGERESAER